MVSFTFLCDVIAGLYMTDDDALDQKEEATTEDDIADEDAWRHLSDITVEFFHPIAVDNEGVWFQTAEQ